MRPQGIPELRARVVAEFQRDTTIPPQYSASELAKMERLKPGLVREYTDATRRRDEAEQELRERHVGPTSLLGHWRMAELFYVAPEMARIAGVATDSMPKFELHRDDLPADIGLLYFDNSAYGKDFDVVSTWGPAWADGRGDALSVSIYTHKLGDLLYLGSLTIGYGEDQIEAEHHEMKTWALVLRCCWLLMQQRIAVEAVQQPDRASERRLRRANKPIDPVRVISLRQPEHHGGPGGDRIYHHRWVVRGHWRKQWYPSQERNVPIWITPYVKGPDGAPLLAGEKVYAWRR
jgi:hypothetical protein